MTARGAKKIVLVPTVPTRYNSLYRQWDYTFDLGAEAAYLPIPPIETDAEVIMAEAFNDDPLMTEVLLDYANEISTNPSEEVVIIVGHGPEDIEENIPDLDKLINDIKISPISDSSNKPISDIFCALKQLEKN